RVDLAIGIDVRRGHAEPSAKRSAQRVLQKYRGCPACDRVTARERTMYVWQTGSFTSSSRTGRGGADGGPHRSQGMTAMTTIASQARIMAARMVSGRA